MLLCLRVLSTLCSIGIALCLQGKPYLNSSSRRGKMKGQKAVVLLRGEIFRWEDVGSCSRHENATRNQWTATDSLKAHILGPLEEHGYTVDIVVSVSRKVGSGDCNRVNEYLDRLGRNQIVYSRTFEADDQLESVQGALETLQTATKHNVAQYDLVFISRNDGIFGEYAGFPYWKGSPANFNFQSSCDNCYQSTKSALADFGTECRLDLMWAMPGHAFDTFAATTGRAGSKCFAAQEWDEPLCRTSGHCCYAAIHEAMASIQVEVGQLDDVCQMWLTELSVDRSRADVQAK